MPEYRRPGVYREEITLSFPTILALPSHIPIFIGYTQQSVFNGDSLLNKPIRINSVVEFEHSFGGDALHKFTITEAKRTQPSDIRLGANTYSLQQSTPNYLLYRSLCWYFNNGGGACYVVSVGNYSTAITTTALLGGLAAVAKQVEPTLVVIPEVVALDTLAQCSQVQQAMIAFCAQDEIKRFAIVDIYQGYYARNQSGQSDCIEAFRQSIGGAHLSYAAAYYPWVNSLIVSEKFLSFANIATIDSLKKLLTMELEQLYTKISKQATAKLKQAKTLITAIENVPLTALSKEQQIECQQLSSSLQATSPLYSQIIVSIKQKLNRLPPSGAICGAYVQNDLGSGVWKAPANIALSSLSSLCVDINNNEQQDLNVSPSGKSVNALRSFSGKGIRIWGARTLAGNDNEWRYVNIRRTVLMIEQALTHGIKTVVFEPNNHTLWSEIRGMSEKFLQQLWRQGALLGEKPEHAYFVRVGLGYTMTEADILANRLIVQVGVALTKPAEFILLKIEQIMEGA